MKKRVEKAASMNCDGILPGAMEVRTRPIATEHVEQKNALSPVLS